MYPKHDEDFYGWTVASMALLKQKRFEEVDMEHLIEELGDMVGNQYNEFVNRLRVLLAHLLKWHYQPSHRSNSWRLTLKEQRKQIKRLIKHNPSLKSRFNEGFIEAYEESILLSARETGLDEKDFPESCPYTFEQCLDEEFYPQ